MDEEEVLYKRWTSGSFVIYAPKSHRIYFHDDPVP